MLEVVPFPQRQHVQCSTFQHIGGKDQFTQHCRQPASELKIASNNLATRIRSVARVLMFKLVVVTREQDGTLYWSTIVYMHTL